jgi:hypothetical protein
MKVLLVLSLLVLCNFATTSLKRIAYSYHLWIGDDAAQKYSIELKSFDGIKFIDAMNQAAVKHDNFRFEYKQFDFGKFITQIAGVHNDDSL